MQEQEEQDIQQEIPAQESEPIESVAAKPEPASVEPTKPSRRLRSMLIWMVGLVIVLAAGVVLTWTLRVQPQADRIASLEEQAIAAQSQIDDLEAEVIELRPLVAENERLGEELTATQAHLDLLDVLVDVTTAQLAMAQEDAIAAEAALEGTGDILAALEKTLNGADAAAVGEMAGRLKLVLEEVESDAFAARRDLEVLANNLLSLERELFGG